MAADAIVIFEDGTGNRRLLTITRGDGHGSGLPGGGLDRIDEDPRTAAVRELREETNLKLLEIHFEAMEPRYVDDPRAGNSAWMVTIPHISILRTDTPPTVTGGDDAETAELLPANSYAEFARAVKTRGSHVFPAHVELLTEVLG